MEFTVNALDMENMTLKSAIRHFQGGFCLYEYALVVFLIGRRFLKCHLTFCPIAKRIVDVDFHVENDLFEEKNGLFIEKKKTED